MSCAKDIWRGSAITEGLVVARARWMDGEAEHCPLVVKLIAAMEKFVFVLLLEV